MLFLYTSRESRWIPIVVNIPTYSSRTPDGHPSNTIVLQHAAVVVDVVVDVVLQVVVFVAPDGYDVALGWFSFSRMPSWNVRKGS